MLTGLTEGQHSVAVRAYDKAGNYNDSVSVFHVDTTGPSLIINDPVSDAVLNTSTVSVSWSATGAAGIAQYKVSLDGGAWIDATMTTSHSFASLADGSHVVSVRCGDNAGNWNVSSVHFETHATAPAVTRHTPTGVSVARDHAITVSFSEAMNESSVNIVVNGVSGTIAWVGNNATFTPSSILAYGTNYTVDVTGKDQLAMPSHTPGHSPP